MPEETTRGERLTAFKGVSLESLEHAIELAVEASDVADGTMLVVSRIEVKTKDDPNVGSYHVTVTPGG